MKKKKKFKLDLKAKIIIVILIVLVAIMSAFIAASLTKNIDVTDVAQSEISIKDIVESNDCEYITDTVSSEEGYDIDIYLKFGKDPVSIDGVSAEPYYSTVFDSIAFKTGYLNVRLIDESREITAKIKCNETKTAVVSILINDVTKDEYFSNLLSEYAKQKPLEITPINMTVSSTELNNLINNGVDIFNIDYNNPQDKVSLALLNHYHYANESLALNKRSIVLTRNHNIAIHRYGIVKTGKTNVDWNTLAILPRFISSASNIGVSYVATAIGGYYNGIEDFEQLY